MAEGRKVSSENAGRGVLSSVRLTKPPLDLRSKICSRACDQSSRLLPNSFQVRPINQRYARLGYGVFALVVGAIASACFDQL
jgi:hypothetical protein